ncbi:hypothetical protein BT69DRAFT_1233734, partial [Atractiella rhizophila]
EMQSVREWIAALEIPTWIERPPTNLGSASHGKLKADTWFVLFTVCLPLILPIIWTGRTDCTERWRNFAFLVTFTNIACAYSLTDDLIDLGEDAYRKFQEGCFKLFPHSPSAPNHHLAGHIPQLQRFWGPLMPLSEWSGEQIIGTLQQFRTNNKFGKLPSPQPLCSR